MSASLPVGPVILVVEDEALIRMHATDMLQDSGFSTFEASGPEDALAQMAQHPEISVLFTDINMPGDFDGLELAHWVHAVRPDIQLILTSGRNAPDRCDIPDNGQFLPKPYDRASLTRLIAA
jgi:CheY-like chemotaxis protein